MAEHSDPFSAAVSREALFRLVAEHATDIIIRANVEGVIDYVSAACATLGYQPGEVIGRSATDFVHPDDLVRFIDNTRRLISGAVVDRAADREHRFLCKDGSWVWLEGNPQVVRDDSGRPLYIVNIFRDVTEKRLLRDQVAEQARFSKMAEDVGGVGYWRLDAKTREITWSPGMFRAFGLNPSRKPPLDVAMAMVHPDDQKASGRRLARALRTGKGWADDTTRIVRPGGEIRFVLGRAICEVEDGVVRAVFGTMVDVTNQRLAERRYQLMAENVTDMIVTTDTAGKITFVAPSCRAITGYDSRELIGKRPTDFSHPDDVANLVDVFRKLASGLPGRTVRWRASHKEKGRWIWLESNPSLIYPDGPQGLPQYLDVIRDVTALAVQEEALATAMKAAEAAAAAKSEFLANMSHEIRTPLTAILGFTGLLAGRSELDDIARGHVLRVSTAGQALLSIVNDVLDFSKLEAGLFTIASKPASPVEIAHGALMMFSPQADAKGLALDFAAEGDIPSHVSLDPDRLRQVLLNLIGNAVKFTDAGRVRLVLRYETNEQRLHIAVEDTGAGLSEDQQAQLFQRFSQVDGSSTRRHGGTGLGLAICKGLVEAMGGQIGVRGRPGDGSTFFLHILAPLTEKQAADALLDLSRLSLEGVRVLVVDDNPTNRELARAVLEAVGAEVTEAIDGQGALHAATSQPFDAILLDIRMPDIDGPETLRRMRAGLGPNRSIPIIAFTADTDVADLSSEDGFDDLVRKPVDPVKLIQTLAKWCHWDWSMSGGVEDANAA